MRLQPAGWHRVAMLDIQGPFVLCHLFNQVFVRTRPHGSISANTAFGLEVPLKIIWATFH